MKILSPKTVNSIARQTAEVARDVIPARVSETLTQLPRFSSPEMVMARTLNKVAIKGAKAPKVFTYPKAPPQDLKRLTSNTLKDSYSRVTWTNPKDGKIYHILKESELPDGNIAIRILNEDGSFLKNASIKPEKIIVIDDFEQNKMSIYGISHGEIVTTFLRRNNPFAQIETINTGLVDTMNPEFIEPFKQILQRIKSGEKIDYISCSKGAICYSTGKDMRGKFPQFQPITDVADSGTRVLFASGNSIDNPTGTANQMLLLADKIEGVGSLSPQTHKLSKFSSSRNSFFTQHYEVGEHYIRPTEYGANITGLQGTDIVINNPKYKQEVENNILIGKTKERVDKLLEKIKAEIKEVQQKKVRLIIGKINFNELRKLEQRENTLEQRRSKLIQLMSTTPLENGKYEATEKFFGTSFSTPIRTAKLALTDMLQDVI